MDLSPQQSVDWDEEEEPLFADDVVNSDEEDPPPLPPPMPPLSQLSQPHARTPHPVREGRRGGGVADWDNTQPAGDGDQGGGDQAAQKKRAPVLTLTTDRIFSEKGLSRIEKEFPKLKFKGKGHEVGDLCYLMQQYEHWANALYPKLTFKDVTDRIEKLATKKDFKSQLIQMRRRWARGQTPPIPDEDEGAIDRHGNDSSSATHPASNLPTSAETGLEPAPERGSGHGPTHSDGGSEDEMESVSNLESLPRHREEEKEEEEDEFEGILMTESDILTERKLLSRKRRESSSQEDEQREAHDGGRTGPEGGQDSRREGGAKRLKLSCEPEDMLEDLLAEEEEFLHETSIGQQAPPAECDA